MNNEMDEAGLRLRKSQPTNFELSHCFVSNTYVEIHLTTTFSINFYPKPLIGENQDCNFYIVHVTLLRSTTWE